MDKFDCWECDLNETIDFTAEMMVPMTLLPALVKLDTLWVSALFPASASVA